MTRFGKALTLALWLTLWLVVVAGVLAMWITEPPQ